MSKKKKLRNAYHFVPTEQNIRKDIDAIAAFPKKLSKVLKKLSVRDLHKSYREGGWTALQVIHHIADSHTMAYLRMKKAVTETKTPTIMGYDQDAFAECVDGNLLPAKVSVQLLMSLHQRWSFFLESLSEDDYKKSYWHPELNRAVSMYEAIGTYAWHGAHHLEQIKRIRKGRGVKVSKQENNNPEEIKVLVKNENFPSIEEIDPFKVLRVIRVVEETVVGQQQNNEIGAISALQPAPLVRVEELSLPSLEKLENAPKQKKKPATKRHKSTAKEKPEREMQKKEQELAPVVGLKPPRKFRTSKGTPRLLEREKPAVPAARSKIGLVELPMVFIKSGDPIVFD